MTSDGNYSPGALDALPGSLLTTGNPKVAKGEARGVLTAIMHLAPAHRSGRNVCPHATPGCTAACLNTAGRGGINLDADGLNRIQVARIRRTRWFHRDRAGFLARLAEEIDGHVRRAQRHGFKPAVRLNGTSDLPFEQFAVRGAPNIMGAFPSVQFYDYTKWPLRLRDCPENYHLTYSLAETSKSEQEAVNALLLGVNVAVVFAVKRGQPLPSSYRLGGIETAVVDGDATDLRFQDPVKTPGVIVGLRAKGDARGDSTGFVRAPESAERET